MAKYRPVDSRLWMDPDFIALSDDGKLLWLFLLTCPTAVPIPGVLLMGNMAIAEQIGWTPERTVATMTEVGSRFAMQREGHVLWLKNALKFQPPHGPKMIIGWSKYWDYIPDGELKLAILESIEIACKPWAKVFAKVFPIDTRRTIGRTIGSTMPTGIGYSNTQYQYQYQDQKQEEEVSNVPPTSVGGGVVVPERAWKAADYLRLRLLESEPNNQVKKKPWGPEVTEKTSLRYKWANAFRLLHEQDERPWDEIASTVKWLFDGQVGDARFVVHAPDTLRKKWDRIQTQRIRPQRTGSYSVSAVLDEALAELNASRSSEGTPGPSTALPALEIQHDPN